MRHRKSGRKLGRNASHRDAMFRNLVTSLLEIEKVQTTDAKAKELRRIAERLITLGKRNAPSLVEAAGSDDEKARLTAVRVAAVRQAARSVRSRDVLQKLFSDLAERYQTRPGGYTRMVRVGRRAGDGAEMVIIELMPDGIAAVEASPVVA
jgi:large subunit ribosomal protein L17